MNGVVEVGTIELADAPPVSLLLVPTWDGLYSPASLQLPPGDDEVPLAILAYGNGGGGLASLEEMVRTRWLAAERLLAAGYAVSWIRYRTEVDLGYATGGALTRGWRAGGELLNRAPLEFEDELATIAALRAHPRVAADRIALIGVSHAGEMILKLLAEPEHGVAVGVAAEPASHEFLALRRADGEDVEQLQVDAVASVLARVDNEVAGARIARITTPILVLGRDTDPLQPVFRATYELLRDAGADVDWHTVDHPEHGYVLPVDAPEEPFADRAGSEAALDLTLAYLDRHLGA